MYEGNAQNSFPAMAQQDVVPGSIAAPANFWEYLTVEYPPELYMYNRQPYWVQLALTAAQTLIGANIQVQVPLFVFDFRSRCYFADSVGNGAPLSTYLIGIAHSSSDDWTMGVWQPAIITGDCGPSGVLSMPFPWPREVEPNTQLTVTVTNLQTAQPIVVHALIDGLEIRTRQSDIRAMHMGAM